MSNIRHTRQGWPLITIELTDEQEKHLAELTKILRQADDEGRPRSAIAQVFPGMGEMVFCILPHEIAAQVQRITAPNYYWENARTGEIAPDVARMIEDQESGQG